MLEGSADGWWLLGPGRVPAPQKEGAGHAGDVSANPWSLQQGWRGGTGRREPEWGLRQAAHPPCPTPQDSWRKAPPSIFKRQALSSHCCRTCYKKCYSFRGLLTRRPEGVCPETAREAQRPFRQPGPGGAALGCCQRGLRVWDNRAHLPPRTVT